MAALDFPASPTNGQVFTSNGSSWTYDSTKVAWRSSPYEPGAAITSATAPTTPQNGDIWFNTNDGTLYTYYNDGTTAQWVEVRSEIATSQVGLVPMIPTSVTMGSGSATVSANGKVSFTTSSSATGVSLNGVFTSAYENYKVVFNGAGSSLGAGIYMRFRNAGTDASAASYFHSGWYTRSNSTANGYWSGHGVNQFDLGRLHTDTTGRKSSSTLDVLGPSTTGRQPMITCLWAGEDSGSPLGGFLNGALALTGTYDGFTIVPSTGTFVGTIKIYGYN